MFKKIAIAASLALFASSAFAAEPNHFYVGGDIGRTSLSDYSDSSTSLGGVAGFQFNRILAIEGGVRRLGSEGGLKVDQLAVSLVATDYAVGEFSNFGVFGRIGVNRMHAHGCDGLLCGVGSENRVLVGLGLVYKNTAHLLTRFEIQRPTSGTSNVSLGLLYNF